MSFKNIDLVKPIQKALSEQGYKTLTPIQQRSIPVILEGKDLLGCAQTGTGKTAAFAIPIIQRLNADKKKFQRRILKSLIVTPTRELAIQIGDSFTKYGKHTDLKNVVVYGGIRQKSQTDSLSKGADILVATPGRLLDLMEQGFIQLNNIETFVLDEADTMLDMGFIHDINKIIANLPKERQSLFFSATMPKDIIKLARSILVKPVRIEISPESTAAETVKQSVYYVAKPNKKSLLIHLLKDPTVKSAIVFTRTKHGADNVAKLLNKVKIKSEAIHGNKTQNSRQRALKNFKIDKTKVLVATDIAARGIDINELSHVFNYELPNIPESYVHRIGRTGRAGLNGVAISFCDQEEKSYLNDIQKLISKKIPIIENHPFALSEVTDEKILELADSSRIKIKGSKKNKYNKPNNGSRKKTIRRNNNNTREN